MVFESALHGNEFIIDDSTPLEVTEAPEGRGKGLDLGLRTTAFGEIKYASAFNMPLIPRAEWQALIQEKEEKKNRLSDIILAAGLPCKDQASTNYCWINAPTYSNEVKRLQQNQPMVLLSPASVGGPMTNFRNVGGWGGPGLEYGVENGWVPVDKWPANAISREYWTPENKKLALDYRVIEWTECQPRNIDQLITLLLLNFPVPVGYNWWSHEVTAVDACWIGGAIAIRIVNSWGMGWGEKGMGILQGTRLVPDDAVTPRTTMPSFGIAA